MSDNPPDAWQRLGGLLRSRRAHIDPSYRNRGKFCEATGLNYKLVQELEGASRTSFTDESLAVLERGYRLVDGSMRRTLAGGPLEPLGLAGSKSPAAEEPAISAPVEAEVLLEFLRSDRTARQRVEEALQQQLRELNAKVDRLSGGPGEEEAEESDKGQLGA